MKNIDDEIAELEERLERKKELKKLSELTVGDDIQNFSEKIAELKIEKINIYSKQNNTDKIKDIENKIEILEQKIIDSFPEDKKLAVFMHLKTCKYSHIDYCSWFYEVENGLHDWTKYSHESYLLKAKRALLITDYDTIVRLIEARIF